MIQVLLRFDSEARFLRYAHAHLGPWFPYLPTRSAYNKRLRRSGSTPPACDRVAGQRFAVVVGRPLVGGLHPGRMRPQPPDRSSALTWEDGPNTATARRIPATFGDCVSI